MGCGRHSMERWQAKMGSMQEKMDRMRTRMGGEGGFGFWQPQSSGNRAFDDYRAETLRRLEEEQREFQDFLVRLREAKDKAVAGSIRAASGQRSRTKRMARVIARHMTRNGAQAQQSR